MWVVTPEDGDLEISDLVHHYGGECRNDSNQENQAGLLLSNAARAYRRAKGQSNRRSRTASSANGVPLGPWRSPSQNHSLSGCQPAMPIL